MQLNFSEQSLIYMQIAQMIEDDILRKVYAEEEQIPSTTEISKLLSINPATANKGINLLVSEGIIYKKRGIGMFVASGAKEIILNKRKSIFIKKFILPMIEEGKNLGLSEDELSKMFSNALSKGDDYNG